METLPVALSGSKPADSAQHHAVSFDPIISESENCAQAKPKLILHNSYFEATKALLSEKLYAKQTTAPKKPSHTRTAAPFRANKSKNVSRASADAAPRIPHLNTYLSVALSYGQSPDSVISTPKIHPKACVPDISHPLVSAYSGEAIYNSQSNCNARHLSASPSKSKFHNSDRSCKETSIRPLSAPRELRKPLISSPKIGLSGRTLASSHLETKTTPATAFSSVQYTKQIETGKLQSSSSAPVLLPLTSSSSNLTNSHFSNPLLAAYQSSPKPPRPPSTGTTSPVKQASRHIKASDPGISPSAPLTPTRLQSPQSSHSVSSSPSLPGTDYNTRQPSLVRAQSAREPSRSNPPEEAQNVTAEEVVAECAISICTPSRPLLQRLQAIHHLNGCFLMLPSYSAAVVVADMAANQPGLVAALVSLVGNGEPHCILAITALTFLANSLQAQSQMLEAGLAPTLAMMLRGSAGTLEPHLGASCLRLLSSLVAGGAAPKMPPSALRGLMGVLLLGLQGRFEGMMNTVLNMLLELLVMPQGRNLLLSMPGLGESLSSAVSRESDAKLKRQLNSTLKLVARMMPTAKQEPVC